MDEYKSVEKYRKKYGMKKVESLNTPKLKQIFISFIVRMLIVAALFLGVLIGCKNPQFKGFIKEQIYNVNFQFAYVKEWYQKNLGNIIPFQNKAPSTKPVFQEKLTYSGANVYKDGVSLKIGTQYLVPVLESGIVVFIGEKEGYGSTVVVQQVNGIDLWYCNITISNLKLYDYVEKGSLLGESVNDNIYLVFQKEGKFLNYKEYLE